MTPARCTRSRSDCSTATDTRRSSSSGCHIRWPDRGRRGQMPGNLTDDEQAFKKRWSRIYKAQEHQAGGYDDLREFGAHVAHSYRQEILRSGPSFNSTALILARGQILFPMHDPA